MSARAFFGGASAGRVTNIFNSGRYYWSAGGRTTAILVQSTEYATALWVGERVLLDRIGIEVTAIAGVTAGHTTRLGIRSDNGNGLPGAVVLDAGTVASDAVAQVEMTISQVLTPGLYWLTGTPQGAGTQPTYRCLTGTSTSIPVGAGNLTQATASTQHIAFTNTGVTGALPATYTVANTVAAGPVVVVRAAAGE